MKVDGKGKKKLGCIPGLLRKNDSVRILSHKTEENQRVTIIQNGNNGGERKEIAGPPTQQRMGEIPLRKLLRRDSRVWARWEGRGASTSELLSGTRCSRLSARAHWPEPLSSASVLVLSQKVWLPISYVSCPPSFSVT